MRVIAGTARGTKLEAPPGQEVRPIPDMVRQALFNILQDEVEGAIFLDLFAGAGTVGIEALSRGAAKCVLVEKASRHKQFIERNLERTHMADRAQVLLRDAFRSPESLRHMNLKFTIIFLGPPFPLWADPRARQELFTLMDKLTEQGLLADGGILVAQHDAQDPVPEETAALKRTDRRAYGRNVLSFYQRKPAGKITP